MSKDNRGTANLESVLDDFEIGVSASSVMTPSGDDVKKGAPFKRSDQSLFDKAMDDDSDSEDDDDDDDADDDNGGAAGGSGTEEDDDDDDNGTSGSGALDDDDDDTGAGDDDTSKNKGGRPTALATAVQTLLDRKVIEPFTDDEKPISEYTTEDFIELIEVNIENGISETAATAPLQVFKTLPKEVQGVVAYSLQGGENWKDVMKAAISVAETIELDPEKEKDQETICREWLVLTGTLTTDEVEEEIATLKDTNQLAKKAGLFKPKLDAKQAEAMEEKLRQQNAAREREIEASKNYKTSVYNTLNNTALNGIPLDPKTQNALFIGATEKRFTDRKGNSTNELGYLLEQNQFGEKPNHALILEALWLLRDPEGYRQKLIDLGEATSTLKTRRDLRTTGNDRSGAGASGNNGTGAAGTGGIKRRNQAGDGLPPRGSAAAGGPQKPAVNPFKRPRA